MKLFNGGKVYNKVLIIPDLHIPFVNIKALKVVHRWCKNHKPDLVIQLGDIFDFKAWSRWPKDTDDASPHDEFEMAIRMGRDVAKMFPNMEILTGNHDLRVAKRAMEVGFTKHIVRELSEVFPYEGWKWHADPLDKLIINTKKGPVWCMHGDEQGGTPAQKSRLLGISVIQGHTHQASITHSSSLAHDLFAMETGHLMNMRSKGAQYAFKMGRYPVMGFGVLKYGIPYFIPVNGDEKNI